MGAMQKTKIAQEVWAELDLLDESVVRMRLNSEEYGSIGSPNYSVVFEWISSKDRTRAESAASKRDAREEEPLSIAKRALSIAEDANLIATRDLSAAVAQARWAKWAAILAVIAAAIATKDQILALIFSP